MQAPQDLERVGVIGLGLMGTAVTRRLLERGFQPIIWNRTRDKANGLIETGAVWSDSPMRECRRVIVCLYSSDVVDQVLSSVLPEISDGQIVVDTTTGDPQHSAAWQRRLLESDAFYLDAPISGSSEQTQRGEATVIVSGDKGAFDACHDLWKVLGRNVFYVGSSGNAARMKLVSNLVLGLNRAALAEGLAYAESLGIDLRLALDVLRGSAAYSRQLDTKGIKMIEKDLVPQARLSQHLKDVRLILDSASEQQLSLPLSETHRSLLETAEQLGLGDKDNSSIIEALRRRT